MNFYFCETCGKRLTEEDIAKGNARDKKLKGKYCSRCAAGVMTMEAMPVVNRGGNAYTTAFGDHTPAAGKTISPPSGTHRPAPAMVNPRLARMPNESPPAATHYWAFAGIGGAVVLFLIAILAISSDHRKPVAEDRAAVSKLQTPEISELPAQHSTPPRSISLLPPTPPAPNPPPAITPKAAPPKLPAASAVGHLGQNHEVQPKLPASPNRNPVAKANSVALPTPNVDAPASPLQGAEPKSPFVYHLKLDGNLTDSSESAIATNWAGMEGIFESGRIGQAVRFNGMVGGTCILAESNESLYGMNQLTVALWFKREDATRSVNLLWNHVRYCLAVSGVHAVNFAIWPGGQQVWPSVNVDSIANTNWHHLAMTYDGSVLRGYVDGVSVLERTGLSGALGGKNKNLTIGRDQWGTSLNGLIDDVRVYRSALSAQEITLLAQSRSNSPTPASPRNVSSPSTEPPQVATAPSTSVPAETASNTKLPTASATTANAPAAKVPEVAAAAPVTASDWIKIATDKELNGDIHGALEAHETACRLDPQSILAHTGCGFLRALEGNLEAARAQADRIEQINPKAGEAWSLRAIVFGALGRTEECEQALSKATLNQPTADRVEASTRYAINIARISCQGRQFELKPPQTCQDYFLRGVSRKIAGRYADAIKDGEAALRKNPGKEISGIYLLLSESAALTSNWKDKLEYLKRWTLAEPDSPSALNCYAWELLSSPTLELQDPKVAWPYAEKAVQLSEKKSASILDTFALACLRNGYLPEARKAAGEALALLSPTEDRKSFEDRIKEIEEAIARSASAPLPAAAPQTRQARR